jgi:integrase
VLTLAAFTERFIEEHVNVYLKGETARHYKSSLRNHILPALGSKPLDEITTSDIERLHRSLKHMHSTANYARTVLSVVFAKAELWDVTTRRNPAQRAARFEERAVERFLSPDERKRLEAELAKAASIKPNQPGYIQPDAMWAIRLLALTGMRHSEVCDLKWDQVDWNRGILRLPDSKTGKRDIVVSDAGDRPAPRDRRGQEPAEARPGRLLPHRRQTAQPRPHLASPPRARRHARPAHPRPPPLRRQRRHHAGRPPGGRRQDARPPQLQDHPALRPHRRHGPPRRRQPHQQDHPESLPRTDMLRATEKRVPFYIQTA